MNDARAPEINRHGTSARTADHPTAEWAAQQLRMVVTGEPSRRFVVHDHDRYSEGVDRTIAAMGLTDLKTPVRTSARRRPPLPGRCRGDGDIVPPRRHEPRHGGA